jgi:hypothetical protein
MCAVLAASDHRRRMHTVQTSETYAKPTAVGRRQGAAFWAVAFAFLVVMAFATLPSPLYGLYRTRDHLSTLTVTLVYAVFACGAIGALLCERVVVARIGRRGAMLSGVATMMVAAAVIAIGKALPALLEAAAPEERVAMTSTLIITALFGLSIPVVGAGVALFAGASAANTVLGFGTAVALGVALSGWALLTRRASPQGGR